MKTAKRFTAIGLAGLMLLSITGCDSFITVKEPRETATPSVQVAPPAAQPSRENPSRTESAVETVAKEQVQRRLNGFYNTLEDPNNYAVVEASQKNLQDRPMEELIQRVNSIPGMDYFPVGKTYPEASQNAKYLLANVDYIENLRGRYKQDGSPLKVVDLAVPLEAITVNGFTATVDPAYIVIRTDGKEQYHDGFTKRPIMLEQQTDGQWYIVAAPNDTFRW